MTTAQLLESLDQSEFECASEECDAFDRLLQAELLSLSKIRANEQKWNSTIRARVNRFNFQTDKEITQRYRRWVKNARICLRQLELQESKECFPESAEEFRAELERAEECLLTRTQDETAASAALRDVE